MNLTAGTIELYSSIIMAPGERLTGQGVDKTVINYHGTFDAFEGSGCAVVPADGCVIENLTINCVNQVSLAGCVGCREQDGDGPSENVVVRNCHLNGLSDTIYVRHTVTCGMRVEGCLLTTKWDLVMLAGALHAVEIERCQLLANGHDYEVNGSQQEANCTTVLGGHLKLRHCALSAAGPLTTRGLWTVGAGWPGFVEGSTIHAAACSIRAKQPFVKAEQTNITFEGCRFLNVSRDLTEPVEKEGWKPSLVNQ